MNTSVQRIIVAGLCLIGQGCSTGYVPAYIAREKHASPATVAPARDGAAAGATAKPVRIVLEDKTLTNDEVRALFAQGYKPQERNGQVFYCRREVQTGSRFATMTCKTADQIKEITQDSKDFLDAKQRPGGCMHEGPGC